MRRAVMRERLNEMQAIVKKSLITSEEVAFLRNVFDFIDTDGDGEDLPSLLSSRVVLSRCCWCCCGAG